MNTPRLALALLMAALAGLSPGIAHAQTYPVDDSASQVLGGSVRMKWTSTVPRPGEPDTLIGRLTVLVRLDVSAWQGRNARIYKKLAAQANGPVVARWTTRGILMAGSLRDGERTLVYSGPVTVPMLEDTLQVTLQADGDRMPEQERLNFTFEIELESP